MSISILTLQYLCSHDAAQFLLMIPAMKPPVDMLDCSDPMSAPAVPVPVLAAVARDTVVVVVEVGQLMARQARHGVPEHRTVVRYLHHDCKYCK